MSDLESNQSSKKRHKLSRKREISLTHEETLRLIDGVKVRPILWKPGRIKARKEIWKEAFDKLNIETIKSDIDMKNRWGRLRDKFSKKKTLGNDWKYAQNMSFLNDIMEEIKAKKQASVKPKFVISDGSPQHQSSSSTTIDCSSTQILDDDLQVIQTSKQDTSIVVSSTIPEPVLIPEDPNLTFCYHLLSELRSFSEMESRKVRRLLMNVAYDFMDNLEA